MGDTIHTEKLRGFTIKIYQDDDARNPFLENDGMPDIIGFHRRYDFNTRKEDKGTSPDDFLQESKDKGYVIRPLYMLDHSGLAFSTSDFNDKWDSGLFGFIFWTPENLKLIGLDESTLKEGETRESMLKAELDLSVKALNDYVQGNVWGFVVEDDKGEPFDSCYGYFGNYDSDFGALNEARGIARSLADDELKTMPEELQKVKAKIESLENDVLYLELTTRTESISGVMELIKAKIEELKKECLAIESRIEELKY